MLFSNGPVAFDLVAAEMCHCWIVYIVHAFILFLLLFFFDVTTWTLGKTEVTSNEETLEIAKLKLCECTNLNEPEVRQNPKQAAKRCCLKRK